MIIGSGAVSTAAAKRLRREGHSGRVSMISADESVPWDRPNLSKDCLAGQAPEDWIPFRSERFYKEHDIELLQDASDRDRPAWQAADLPDGGTRDMMLLLVS